MPNKIAVNPGPCSFLLSLIIKNPKWLFSNEKVNDLKLLIMILFTAVQMIRMK